MKLSKPQLDLLWSSKGDGVRCIDSYKPAKKLIELGLVNSHAGSFGTISITINEAGKAVLAKASLSAGDAT